jgi:predicted AlkP superfamily pyrophosphatase or phosphodiesterase
MKKMFAVILLSVGVVMGQVALKGNAAGKPKLVLAIMIDQFRYDYLTRFRGEYSGGLNRLLTKGAVFTNAEYEHFPTVTAVGHSTFLTGATPSISGIIGNDWYDRASGKNVTSVTDDTVKLVGGRTDAGASPRRMLVSTVGDELKIANDGKSRVIGISFKDRSSVLPAGHMADGAFWFEAKTANVVSSTYYFPDLPGWVKDFNSSKPADKYLGAVWNLAPYSDKTIKMAATPSEKYYDDLKATPFGNELIESFAERAITAEQLGKRDTTDVLAVSFSSNDYVGHDTGPDSPEVHAMCVLTDQLLDKFFRFVDGQVGIENVLVVVSADHGVVSRPEVTAARKMPGGRMPARVIQDAVQAGLTEKFGEGKWIISPSEHSLYLNRELMHQKKLDERIVERAAMEVVRVIPHVARVYTREQLANGQAMEDEVGRRVMNGYNTQRGADLVMVLEPYWIYPSRDPRQVTTHGTPYTYDAHVPVIFMGPNIKAGRYNRKVAVNDIAPTLATILDVATPSGSVGRVLSEMLVSQ